MAKPLKPKATLSSVEDFLYELGPVKGDTITFKGIQFEVSKFERKRPPTLEISFEYPGSKSALNSFKSAIFKAVRGHFGTVDVQTKKYGSYEALYILSDKAFLYLEPQNISGKGTGTVPANIHEKGTAIVFTRALSSKKPFKSEDDLKNDAKMQTELKKIFGTKYGHRLSDWLHSFYEQQRAALIEYSGPQWEEFVYGNGSFVDFFEKHMDKLHRDLEPEVKVGRYEKWNPSDIWAVKRGKMEEIKTMLKKEIGKQTVLVELNAILVNLMEDNDLVGISLKKIDAKSSGNIKLYNVDTSDKLKALKSYAHIELYDMNDISFEPDNILILKSVTTYIRIGPGGKYFIDVTRSGKNLSFNSQIRGTAAQGGQAPIDLVVKMLNGNTFNKNNSAYPQDVDSFEKEVGDYKKMYKVVSKYASSNSQKMNIDSWIDGVKNLYKKDSRNAIVTLMQLSFWHDALMNHAKNPEFWTDLLYYGMKVTSKGMFAPHAKIS
tara:strand:+ start:199 stop:1671 length:1473 start_codon:yes stop_codon:yes gene_type:complete